MNLPRQLVQIVPRFHPQFCGVGDYSRLLGLELLKRNSFKSCIFVADKCWKPCSAESEFRIQSFKRRKLRLLFEQCNDLAVGILLQYSGYGYARRGAPFWLLREARALKRTRPGIRFVTMFHEVAASGRIHTSAFWMRPFQLYVARFLCSISDAVLTNCDANAAVLEKLLCRIQGKVIVQPVYSNFGDESRLVPWMNRERRMVVFTSSFGGLQPSADFWSHVQNAMVKVKASRLVTIGKQVVLPGCFNAPVLQLGYIPEAVVTNFLSETSFGYVFNGPRLLGKSGIFAAFAAHGVTPLVATAEHALPDGLTHQKTYHALFGDHQLGCADESYFASVSDKVREWYRPHSVSKTAEIYENLFHVNDKL